MYTLLVSFYLLSLITQTRAQVDLTIRYDAPSLETGVIAVSAVFTLTTLIQLIIVWTYLNRGRSPHILPAVLVLWGMLFLLISYVMRILEVLTRYVFFDLMLPKKLTARFDIANAIFFDWADPLIFVAVALIVRDRYRTHRQNAKSDKRPIKPLSIGLFMIPFYVLAAFIVIFTSSSIGVLHTLPTFSPTLSETQFEAQLANRDARIKLGNRLLYAAETMYCLGTVLLVPLAILVRSRIGRDKLMNWTLFAIIPVLCMRVIPQIVILVEEAKPTLDDITSEQLNLASVVTDSTFYFVAFCFFCYIFLWTRLWHSPDKQSSSSYGQIPLAQFPGQWGNLQGVAYMYVQNASGGEYVPAQGQPQNGQGPLEQHSLPQTQQVSGPEKVLPGQPA